MATSSSSKVLLILAAPSPALLLLAARCSLSYAAGSCHPPPLPGLWDASQCCCLFSVWIVGLLSLLGCDVAAGVGAAGCVCSSAEFCGWLAFGSLLALLLQVAQVSQVQRILHSSLPFEACSAN
ncbi:hypothetical protein U1Q18_047899 [Sarracenia purpurea var. burkii]